MSPHTVINFVISLLYVAIWVIVPGTWALTAQQLVLWHVAMVMVGLAMVAPCLHLLRPDAMLLGTFNGEIFEVYAPTGSGNRGILGSGIVLLFPPVLTKGYIFPLTVVTVPIVASGAMTKQVGKQRLTPVTAYLGLQFRLAPHLEGMRGFVRTFPVLKGRSRDLTCPDNLQFYKEMTITGIALMEDKPSSCLARIMRDELQSPVAEATSRAVAGFPLKAVLRDWKPIETAILAEFPGTILEQANMVSMVSGTGIGTACTMLDFNVEKIVPSDPDTAMALSSETKEQYEASGRVARAEGDRTVREKQGAGEASFISQVAAQAATPEGLASLQAETLRKTGANVTIVTTPGALLDAAAAKIVKTP